MEQHNRTKSMVELFKMGMTCAAIGDIYSLTRERVRQILVSQGIKKQDGGSYYTHRILGKTYTARLARLALENKRERILKNYKCTVEEYDRIMHNMRFKCHVSCLAYCYWGQKRNALARGIEFDLSFPEWHKIWVNSGHLSDRGRGSGYVMARLGDIGHYSINNVAIIKASQNSSDAWKYKKWNAGRKSLFTTEERKQRIKEYKRRQYKSRLLSY